MYSNYHYGHYRGDHYYYKNCCNDLLFYALLSGRCCNRSVQYIPYPVIQPCVIATSNFGGYGHPYRLM